MGTDTQLSGGEVSIARFKPKPARSNELPSYTAAQFEILSPVDHPHATPANDLKDAKIGNFLADKPCLQSLQSGTIFSLAVSGRVFRQELKRLNPLHGNHEPIALEHGEPNGHHWDNNMKANREGELHPSKRSIGSIVAACMQGLILGAVHRSNPCHTSGSRIFLLRILGISWQDAGEGVGRMSTQKRQVLWFAGIYMSSLIVFTLVTYLLRSALRLL